MKILTLLLFLVLSTTLMAQPSGNKNKSLRHVVLVQFKSTATQADIDKVIEDFGALKAQMKQIKEFEWGLNNSPENLSEGLTHAFLLTFRSEKDRDEYLVHPTHKAFVEGAGKHMGKVVVVDYYTN